MKIKKEYVVLVVVIIALCGYLFMRNSDRTQYALPEIASVKPAEVSKVEITKADEVIVLTKNEADGWTIVPAGYSADSGKVDGMLEAIGDLTVTALVSEAESYGRYDLDEGKRISIKAWAGDRLAREFEIGKAASSFRHTFVKLKGDKGVYHARGNFRTRFDQTVDGLRDKTVLSFEADGIHEIAVSRSGKTLAFTRTEALEDEKGEASEGEGAPSTKALTVWKTPEGQEGDTAEFKKLLAALSNLRCDQFINDKKKEDFQNPTHTFRLKGGQEYLMSLYPAIDDEDKKVPAVASGSDYPFFLPQWQVDNLTRKLDDLIKKPTTAREPDKK